MLRKHADEPCINILQDAQTVEFPADKVLFSEASPCSNFMWLMDGSVRVYKNSEEGREVTIYRVSPGELCLLSLNSMLDGNSYPASAKTDTIIKGLMISAKQFSELMENSRGFRDYVLLALIERLSDVMTLLSDVVFRRLDLRLACLLGQQFERSRGEPLEITHAQLACELGTTREVISRILKEFERQECIYLSRGQIHLISQDGLKWFTENKKAV
jgi:CRP/FNR family transcriptional regulator